MCGSNDPSLLYLWNLRTLYIGPLFEEVANIIPAASSLVIGIDDDIQIHVQEKKRTIRTRVALLPAGVAFSAETGNKKVASLYLDPVGHDLALLRSLMSQSAGGIYFDCVHQSALIDTMQHILAHHPSPADTYAILRKQVFAPAMTHGFTHEVDPRIWQTIDYVKVNAIDNLSSDTLAARVGMSDAQLRRAFKQTTGIPLRRYRRWHRLFITATLMATGKTLTDAALAAGFSDSSHFNHAFKEMLGAKPSTLLRRKDNIKIFVGAENTY